MSGRWRRLWPAAGLGAAVLAPCPTAWASTWAVPLHTASSGEAQAGPALPAPGSPAAACTSPSGKTIKVTWSAVPHATSYTVYESTTSSSSGYSVAASGVATTSWTTGTLANGHYWFEVAALAGTNWVSSKSAATARTTITTATTSCSQP